MAQYKVIQDIEAEDKLLGPLSLRQFIYAIIVIALGFVAFQVAKAAWFLAIIFLPPMVFFGLLAAPFGTVQSSEVWLLAKIKFVIFPKKRIWNQDGILELVTITAPKKVEKHLTKDLSKDEVSSRLQALANTLDSRGWIIKNVSPEAFRTATAHNSQEADRLIDINALTGGNGDPTSPDEDILDPTGQSPIARQMSSMLQQSTSQHRQELMQKMRQAAAQQDKRTTTQTVSNTTAVPTSPASPIQQNTANNSVNPQFTPPALQAQTAPMPVVTPQPVQQVAQTAPQPVAQILSKSGQPLQPANSANAPTPQNQAQTPMTNTSNTDKITSVNDKSSGSVELNRKTDTSSDDNEVVISLH